MLVHSHFGEFGPLENLMTLCQLRLADGRSIPLDFYMTEARVEDFVPADLDIFVPLSQQIPTLDARFRAAFPEQMRQDWLNDRLGAGAEDWAPLMESRFPGAKRAEDVGRADFIDALELRRGCFSLVPKDSGEAALTLDYQILPADEDNNVFAARFALDGSFLDVVIES